MFDRIEFTRLQNMFGYFGRKRIYFISCIKTSLFIQVSRILQHAQLFSSVFWGEGVWNVAHRVSYYFFESVFNTLRVDLELDLLVGLYDSIGTFIRTQKSRRSRVHLFLDIYYKETNYFTPYLGLQGVDMFKCFQQDY